MLVHIVEVAEHELAPSVELVERLVGVLHYFEVNFVQFADEHDVVGNLQVGLLAEEFADGDVLRTPYGCGADVLQGFVEEE